MSHRYPDLGDPSRADEGTLAHEVLHSVMLGKPLPAEATDEMLDAAEMAVDHLKTLGVVEWVSERRLTGKAVHDSQNWGTPDLIGWAPLHLHVLDLKFGYGYVPADTLQLVNYALLELERAGIDAGKGQHVQVSLHIIQPRAFGHKPIRTKSYVASDLRAHANILRGAAIKATQMNPVATTGPQCDHCNGRHACDALRQVTGRVVDMSSASAPVDASPQAMGVELAVLETALRRLEARVSGLQEQVMHHVKAGAAGTGYRVDHGIGRERWLLPPEDVVMLMGDAVRKPGVALLTPAQARKACIPTDGMTERPAGASKLVPVDHGAAVAAFGTP
jgi:hypothetical protein